MGILPLQFIPGESLRILGLTGQDVFRIGVGKEVLEPGCHHQADPAGNRTAAEGL